ncbi:MAG TPA: hypothetical protein VGY77_06515, partial [Gemmataceae bacterium]|nr:hypothetical protein [Gemmataceae bacterium]
GRVLNENPNPELREDLQRQLADVHSPIPLRIELAHLLKSANLLEAELPEQLIDPVNPAPLRLIAAEALLDFGDHPGAITALRDIARLPNREIALATASVVQRFLGVELGLPAGQPLPSVQSRLAAEVTRRVMTWAAQDPQQEIEAIAEPLHQ